GEAAVFGIPVLLAALGDHGATRVRGEDLLCLIGRGAEHAHGMIVRQHDVFDRLVGGLAHALDDEAGHDPCGLCIAYDDALVAHDGAAVWGTLGGGGGEVRGGFRRRGSLVGPVGRGG